MPRPSIPRSGGAKVLPLVRSASGPPVVVCEDVSKRFHHYEHRPRTLREAFVGRFRKETHQPDRADFTLTGFSLRITRGESVGFVGRNGSGKSTALRLIAGIYQPTSGRVTTYGRIASIIDLGAGFHPDLTGIENIYQYAAALGLQRRETRARLSDVIEFAELGNFITEPLRLYSTGMRGRLAFAAAMLCAEPDLLLLDEVLSVGDQGFQQRCFQLLNDFNARGGTLIAVSHEGSTIQSLCDRAVWLDGGRTRMIGPADDVIAAYSGDYPGAQAMPIG